MKNLYWIFAGLLAIGIAHAETARTLRSSELQAQAYADAPKISTLPQNTKVTVLRRSGAWSEVKTGSGQTGWVRMLNLRFDGNPASAGNTSRDVGKSSGTLNNLLSSGRTSGTATVTTGVRGLSEEELQGGQANPAEPGSER